MQMDDSREELGGGEASCASTQRKHGRENTLEEKNEENP